MTLLAIPMFFVAGCAATTLAVARAPSVRTLSWVLALECFLLTALLAVMLATAPVEREAWAVVVAALIGIAAMGVQSAAVRLFMKGTPSTNVMTMNTTQLAIDATIVLLALCGRGDAAQAQDSAHATWRLLAADGGLHPRHGDWHAVLQAVGTARARRADRGGLCAARLDITQPFAFIELNRSNASVGFIDPLHSHLICRRADR